jgi:nanoRNase/pAp phosphatase (c-di-AMP/oligoRNAs hydrolase)
MALTTHEQAKTLISRAKRVLITFPPGHGGDAVGSSLGLALALQKLGKQVDIISPTFSLPGNLRFLPQAKTIKTEARGLRKFIVSVGIERTGLSDLSYSVEHDKLNIYLTPRQGALTASDLTTQSAEFAYDLIVVVDTPDLKTLGDLFASNTEFFYQTTILNLDHSPANEHFGQVNLVDFNVPSTAELALRLIEQVAPEVLDADVATCLFAGITAATKSFTSTLVTPDTLAHAARLVSLGARRDEVVAHLYRTKQLSTLKLWGRVLARLKSDSARKLVWSQLVPDDFVKSGASEGDLPGVIDELITTAPEAGSVVLLYEQTLGTTTAFLAAGSGRHALELLKPFNPTGDRHRAKVILTGSVLEAEKRIIEHLRNAIPALE